MTEEGRKTIIRHLKGIVAALEKEEPKKLHYRGQLIETCNNEEVMEAYNDLRRSNRYHYDKNWHDNFLSICKEVISRKLLKPDQISME